MKAKNVWHEHDGGKCPIKGTFVALIRYQDGLEKKTNIGLDCVWEWVPGWDETNILRYMVIEQQESP